jgi:protein involved in polysaccharide export with SLBB domain
LIAAGNPEVLLLMKFNFARWVRCGWICLLPVTALFFAGCVAPVLPESGPDDGAVARFHVGDTVTVVFAGLPEDLTPHEEPIKEDGTITLDTIGAVKAVGKTAGQLQNEIHDLYVPKYYTHLTVTVKTGDRVFFVNGEVKGPGRQIYAGQMTVTKAITSAGDFTDYANRKKVWLIRANGQRLKLNCDDIMDGSAPDPQVYPGDQIQVTRRLF